MRTSEEIYHRVRWDARFDPARFVLGVMQRGAAPKRVPLPAFVPGGEIPWHRVLFFEADGEVVWDRATGVDRIDATEAGRVRQARLLRAPFFTARTPYVWDGEGWVPAHSPREGTPLTGSGGVRVLTWNTLWDRYDADRIDSARRRPLLLRALRDADVDVIALQEVEAELVAMLLREPWVRADWTLGTDPRGRDVDECGLLLLSRLPVREAAFHELGPHKAVTAVVVDAEGMRAEGMRAEGATGAVESGVRPLVVAATHLSSDHSENGAGRRDVELAQVTEGLAGLDADVILLGDFNDGGDTPQLALGMRDAWSETHGADDMTPTFDPRANPLAAISSLTGRASRLDRVLVRGEAVRVRRAELYGDAPTAEGSYISDHYGVRAEMTLDTPETDGRDTAALDRLDARPTPRTALAWLPPQELWPPLQDIRRNHDPQIHRWPPHVNVLFGFVPEHAFEQAAAALATTTTAPFDARLEGVHWFGHRDYATVWLDPAADGEEPWAALHSMLLRHFPRCRGRHEGFTPHLSLGRTTDPNALAAACAARLTPMPVRVGELALLSRRGDEPMRLRGTMTLGTGEVRWAEEAPHYGYEAAEYYGYDAGDTDVDYGYDPADTDVADTAVADTAVADRIIPGITEALPDGVVHVVGSRRMGCALPGADLDLVAALPGTVELAAVQAELSKALPEAADVREVVGARVPGLRLRLDRLDVDLVVVATGSMDPAEAVDRRVELGEAAAVALSAVSDADAVLASAGAHGPAFARLARQVKAWARARGLDSAPFGGLPGLAWSVLAARTAGEAGDLPPYDLLRHFFATWAAWDWRTPVGPAGQSHALPLTITTPSAPIRPCTDQVTAGMRDLVTQELFRAWEVLEGAPTDPTARYPWAELLAPPPLHRRHAAWAVVTAGPGADEGRLRGRMRSLITDLAETTPDCHAWPRPFTTTPTRYAIGLGAAPPTADDLKAVAERRLRGLPGVTLTRVEGGEVPTLY
ncbi:RNA repair domain-containing protein [Streptomyces ipomoeae]|uniref:poly(A) polymerase n=1 Tax=Streptomyces ipomoeae TaxID=103232 RepID=UPI0029A57738|nr:poly(A) polymerase [Streptomyces ipomoeae]MDX2820905.1 RNA repair domain-containing protein [Streptomyces ipomoeae]MDX2873536.1 RNA repair domain-containing protein [Streptomyces ipomoeae]